MRLLDDNLYTAVMVYLESLPLKDSVALWMAFQKLKPAEDKKEEPRELGPMDNSDDVA